MRADPGYLDRGMLRVVMLDRTAPRDPGPVMTLAGWSPRKMPLQVPQEPIVTECPDMPGRISRRVIFVADPATVRLCRNSIETAWLARLCRLGGDYGGHFIAVTACRMTPTAQIRHSPPTGLADAPEGGLLVSRSITLGE